MEDIKFNKHITSDEIIFEIESQNEDFTKQTTTFIHVMKNTLLPHTGNRKGPSKVCHQRFAISLPWLH